MKNKKKNDTVINEGAIVIRKSTLGKMKDAWQLYALIALPVIYIIIFHYIPMFGVQIAFKNYKAKLGIWGSPWIGFDHFIEFLDNPNFFAYFLNTLRISVYSLLASTPIPIILALGLNVMRCKAYKKTVQMLSYMPHFISIVVLISILSQFFNPQVGMLKNICTSLGIEYTDSPMYSADAFPHLYVWSGVWQNMGWSSIIYLAALSSADIETTEAALIDGATRFQRLRYIDFPTIVPTIIILLIMNFGKVMSVGFEKVLLMQNDLNTTTSEVISTYSYKVGFGKLSSESMNRYDYSTSISLFNSIINLTLITVVNKISSKVSETSLW